MSTNDDPKKSHEAAVLNDVLSFSRAQGGYRKKQSAKLAGKVDSEHERPDLVISRSDNSAIGLEHFRVDHHIGKGKKAESSAAKLNGQFEKKHHTALTRAS